MDNHIQENKCWKYEGIDLDSEYYDFEFVMFKNSFNVSWEYINWEYSKK